MSIFTAEFFQPNVFEPAGEVPPLVDQPAERHRSADRVEVRRPAYDRPAGLQFSRLPSASDLVSASRGVAAAFATAMLVICSGPAISEPPERVGFSGPIVSSTPALTEESLLADLQRSLGAERAEHYLRIAALGLRARPGAVEQQRKASTEDAVLSWLQAE